MKAEDDRSPICSVEMGMHYATQHSIHHRIRRHSSHIKRLTLDCGAQVTLNFCTRTLPKLM